MKIISLKKNKMKLLTKEQQEPYENVKMYYICHCYYSVEYRGVAHSICNLKYSVPKKILIVFHNGSNSDCYFIIKELAEEFKKQFTCLGENTEKYITFTAPTEKKLTRIDKSGEKITKIYYMFYKLLISQDLSQAHEEYFLEVDIPYLKKLHELHNNLSFLPEKMKIEKVEKLVANLYDKTEYVIHIRNLKVALTMD